MEIGDIRMLVAALTILEILAGARARERGIAQGRRAGGVRDLTGGPALGVTARRGGATARFGDRRSSIPRALPKARLIRSRFLSEFVSCCHTFAPNQS